MIVANPTSQSKIKELSNTFKLSYYRLMHKEFTKTIGLVIALLGVGVGVSLAGNVQLLTRQASGLSGGTNLTNKDFESSMEKSDNVPPNVMFIHPEHDETVPRKALVLLTADANDNIAIQKVEFFANDKLQCADYEAPFTCNWTADNRVGKVDEMTVKAFDTAGNSSTESILITTN